MEEKKSKRNNGTHTNGKNKHKKSPVSLGLCNLGNTCYANSVIQVLNHTKEFHSLLDGLGSQHMWRISPKDDFWSIWYIHLILEKGFSSTEPFVRAEEVLDIIK